MCPNGEEMRVLITGVSGFIGRHVAEQLLTGPYRLTGLIRPGTVSERVSRFTGKIELVEIDLADGRALQRFLSSRRFDVILHIGALRGARKFARDVYRAVNIAATRILMEYALTRQSRFIFCSSVGVFGAVPVTLPADNATPRQPDTFYHYTKIESEKILLQFVDRGLKAVIVRPSITYGEGDYGFPYTLVRLVDHHRLLLPCRPVNIHLTSVWLLVQVFEKLLVHPFEPGSAYIVADKTPVSLQELVDFIHQQLHGGVYPAYLKLPTGLFDLAGGMFKLLGSETWRTRFLLISRSWYYDIENTFNDLQIVPVATIPAFQTVVDWYKKVN